MDKFSKRVGKELVTDWQRQLGEAYVHVGNPKLGSTNPAGHAQLWSKEIFKRPSRDPQEIFNSLNLHSDFGDQAALGIGSRRTYICWEGDSSSPAASNEPGVYPEVIDVREPALFRRPCALVSRTLRLQLAERI